MLGVDLYGHTTGVVANSSVFISTHVKVISIKGVANSIKSVIIEEEGRLKTKANALGVDRKLNKTVIKMIADYINV